MLMLKSAKFLFVFAMIVAVYGQDEDYDAGGYDGGDDSGYGNIMPEGFDSGFDEGGFDRGYSPSSDQVFPFSYGSESKLSHVISPRLKSTEKVSQAAKILVKPAKQ